MKSPVRLKLVILLCFVGLLLWLWGVNYPFVGIYNANNNYLMLAAKNYIRFGFTTLKFFPTYFAGQQLPSPIPYYLHHPILIFPLSTIPFLIFGFRNWVVHATNFLFLLGDILLIYKLGGLLWNKKVGLWAAGLAVIFPMTAFFWKYIFFEQASLFFNLLIFYYFVRFLKGQRRSFLFIIFLISFVSGLIDWGVLYLLIPFLVFLFTKYKKHFVKPYATYIVGAVLSLGLFIVSVYVTQHGFIELGSAIWSRSYTAELTSLSIWPIRLLAISILRMVLYFTPISLAAIWLFYRLLRRRQSFPELSLLFFFIYGCLNLIFLPTASWGHSYFLFYFIPFFAFTGGLFMEQIEKKTSRIWLWITVLVFCSVAVNYLKLQQVKKQLWKYDVAANINKTLKPYETVGVINFAGDIFENYFLHPTVPIPYGKLNDWLEGRSYTGGTNAVYVCEGNCSEGERAQAAALQSSGLVTTYEAGGNEAWRITKQSHGQAPVTEIIYPTNTVQVRDGNILLKVYRFLRDTLAVGQI